MPQSTATRTQRAIFTKRLTDVPSLFGIPDSFPCCLNRLSTVAGNCSTEKFEENRRIMEMLAPSRFAVYTYKGCANDDENKIPSTFQYVIDSRMPGKRSGGVNEYKNNEVQLEKLSMFFDHLPDCYCQPASKYCRTQSAVPQIVQRLEIRKHPNEMFP